MSADRIVVVAGLGRSGTSLMLQMLHAAGLPCIGEWPAFESPYMMPVQGCVSRALFESAKGGAFKLLMPDRVDLPKGFAYRFILMTRDPREQARSSINPALVD